MLANTPTGPGRPVDRMPTLFLSHGGPLLSEDPVWTRQLSDLAAGLPTPESILVVSAHWEEAPLTVGATEPGPPVYDLQSIPEQYWELIRDDSIDYPAPGAPDLATDVVTLLGSAHHDPDRGLDHGVFIPLREMYPKADIPVLQISMPSLDPTVLLEVGRRLTPLRDQRALIIASGFTTHNLVDIDLDPTDREVTPPSWSVEFDDWVNRTMTAGDVDALVDFEHKAPAARMAHPRTEHFAPLFVALGASLEELSSTTVVDGFWFGQSRRSFQLS